MIVLKELDSKNTAQLLGKKIMTFNIQLSISILMNVYLPCKKVYIIICILYIFHLLVSSEILLSQANK